VSGAAAVRAAAGGITTSAPAVAEARESGPAQPTHTTTSAGSDGGTSTTPGRVRSASSRKGFAPVMATRNATGGGDDGGAGVVAGDGVLGVELSRHETRPIVDGGDDRDAGVRRDRQRAANELGAIVRQRQDGGRLAASEIPHLRQHVGVERVGVRTARAQRHEGDVVGRGAHRRPFRCAAVRGRRVGDDEDPFRRKGGAPREIDGGVERGIRIGRPQPRQRALEFPASGGKLADEARFRRRRDQPDASAARKGRRPRRGTSAGERQALAASPCGRSC
jgi:hypothetical protein